MLNNLLRFNKSQKYIGFDLETCSLNLCVDNLPWECGIIIGTLDNIEASRSFYVKWEPLNISADAARITRFNRTLYQDNWQDPNAILKELEGALYNPEYLVFGHNILNFDIHVHQIWRRALGFKTDYSYLPRCIDTNCLSKALKETISLKEGEDRLAWQLKLAQHHRKGLKTSLGTMVKELGIKHDESAFHSATIDIELNYQILKKLIYSLEI